MVATMTVEEREQLLRKFDRAVDDLARAAKERPAPNYHSLKPEKNAIAALQKEYFERLPRIDLSRCPFCEAVMTHSFDPWGLDGLWWQSRRSMTVQEPKHCEHFRLLLGAVNLNGKPPHAGRYGSTPGPEVPYVIPRILNLPTMTAVVAAVPLACGYTAFPIAYFSQVRPPTGSLTQPWTKQQYAFQDDHGRPCWSISTDPWDFNLEPWVRCGKLKWIEPDDPDRKIHQGGDGSAFPYLNLPGRREQLTITGDFLSTSPPPSGEIIDPFSG